MMNVSVSIGVVAATCTLVGVVVGIVLTGWYMTGGKW